MAIFSVSYNWDIMIQSTNNIHIQLSRVLYKHFEICECVNCCQLLLINQNVNIYMTVVNRLSIVEVYTNNDCDKPKATLNLSRHTHTDRNAHSKYDEFAEDTSVTGSETECPPMQCAFLFLFVIVTVAVVAGCIYSHSVSLVQSNDFAFYILLLDCCFTLLPKPLCVCTAILICVIMQKKETILFIYFFAF